VTTDPDDHPGLQGRGDRNVGEEFTLLGSEAKKGLISGSARKRAEAHQGKNNDE